jgi:hypothetical protein
MPILRAAPRDRSSPRPRTKGPQSFIRTVTVRPFLGFSTLTIDPSGSVLDAAVIRLGSKRSPLVVGRPANSVPYHEALTKWARGLGGGAGAYVIGDGGSATGVTCVVVHPGMINNTTILQ